MKIEAALNNASRIIANCETRAQERDLIQDNCRLCKGDWSQCGEFEECTSCKAYTQPVYTHDFFEAEKTITLADKFASLSVADKNRLAAHLVFATDYRDCRDIKENLSVSWNELRTLADWSRS